MSSDEHDEGVPFAVDMDFSAAQDSLLAAILVSDPPWKVRECIESLQAIYQEVWNTAEMEERYRHFQARVMKEWFASGEAMLAAFAQHQPQCGD
jgi:hypothetical protein